MAGVPAGLGLAGGMPVAGAMVPGGMVPAGYGMGGYPVAPAGWAGPMVWHEVPPPLFSAMVDLAYLMEPVEGERLAWEPETEALAARLAAELPTQAVRLGAGLGMGEQEGGLLAEVGVINSDFEARWPAVAALAARWERVAPDQRVTLAAGFPLIDCQGDPAEDLEALGAETRVRCQARTLWRRQLQRPRLKGAARRLMVPRRPAPPLILPMRTLAARPPQGAFEALERRAS